MPERADWANAERLYMLDMRLDPNETPICLELEG
jgi:hypothetical protein